MWQNELIDNGYSYGSGCSEKKCVEHDQAEEDVQLRQILPYWIYEGQQARLDLIVYEKYT